MAALHKKHMIIKPYLIRLPKYSQPLFKKKVPETACSAIFAKQKEMAQKYLEQPIKKPENQACNVSYISY